MTDELLRLLLREQRQTNALLRFLCEREIAKEDNGPHSRQKLWDELERITDPRRGKALPPEPRGWRSPG